jgi:phosphoribosylamine--glycine ligase
VNVFVIGSGGREHALVWKIAQSPMVEAVYCAPGNAGIAREAECLEIGVNDFPTLIAAARECEAGLVVVGPEDPLARGIADAFRAEGFRVFGPSAAAARLEASKAFAKHVMTEASIPTGRCAEFSSADEAVEHVRRHGAPIVVKADGLAAGKGVAVAHDEASAVEAIRAMMSEKVYGEAGNRVLLEEYLEGEEASILALTDGKHVLPLATSQDHKPVYDNDRGPNTGGMGAYSPAPVVSDELFEMILGSILQPCVHEMARQGAPYTGVLYAGLMITADGPRVIEFNCRFGDPETQAVLPRLEGDIVPALLACSAAEGDAEFGALKDIELQWRPEACVSVCMVSGGYPGSYAKGKSVSGIEGAEAEGAIVFHAGTVLRNGEVVTSGGRVLNVTALGSDIADAIHRAYVGVHKISFEREHYRQDIGRKALRRLQQK